jgi:hypothetical protein
MEKQYKLFLAIISLWVVHKLVKHTHGYELFKGTIKERYTNPSNKTAGVDDLTDGVKDGVTGVDDLTDGVKDGVTGVDDLTGNTFGGVFAGMSFILLFFLGIFLILLPFLIFIRWIYLEITCKSCKPCK